MTTNPGYPLLAACIACALPAAANDRLEEVIVTSSRTEMPLRQVGTSVSVLTAEDIERLGFTSLPDILRSQPAVAVSNFGGAGKVSTLRIRGEEGYRTRIFMDGIDISDTSATQFSPRLEQFLSAGIERVEILRGPQGMMYGADAGGVINITSAVPEKGVSGGIDAQAGRYDSRQLAGNLGWGGEKLNGNLSVADLETDGFNARTTDTVLHDDDGYENATVHARLGWQPSENLGFSLVARNVDGDNEYDSCYTADFQPTDACSDEYRQRAWRGAGKLQTGAFSHELAYSESRTKRAFLSEGSESYATRGKLEKWSYLGGYRGVDALGLVYGVDLERDSREEEGADQSREQDGYFLEYQGNFAERFFLTAGARYDDNEDFGGYTSWRVSGAWLIPARGGQFKLRGAWGTGFRAPSLYEIGYNRGPFAYPPAAGVELDAEESEGFDLALSWYGDSGLYLEAVYFDQAIDKEIYYDLIDYSGYLQGDGEAQSSGIELIAEWPLLDNLSLTGNYTWNDTEAADGGPRVYRPEHLANVGFNWQGLQGRLTLGINARLARDAVDTLGQPMDDYEVVDAHASFAVLPGIDVYGRVENLLDEEYEEVPTYNTGGAAAYAGVRYTF